MNTNDQRSNPQVTNNITPINSFQLTDAEFNATKGYLPDAVREALRRPNEISAARTSACRKVAAFFDSENAMLERYKRSLQLRNDIAELEGAAEDVGQLLAENKALKRTVENRDAEIERIKNGQLRKAIAPAMAVNS